MSGVEWGTPCVGIPKSTGALGKGGWPAINYGRDLPDAVLHYGLPI